MKLSKPKTPIKTWVPASRGIDLNIKITPQTATAYAAVQKGGTR